jgi:hypothetical protein
MMFDFVILIDSLGSAIILPHFLHLTTRQIELSEFSVFS